jgi:hypothetical protein
VPRWPAIRAGLIAVAIGFGLIEGLPIPPPGDELDWQKPYVEPIRTVQHVLTYPVAWLGPTLRITQRFALFQVAGAQRFRFRVEGHAQGEWKILYRAGDPEHRDFANLLEYRRINGLTNPTDRPPVLYKRFAGWFTNYVLDSRFDLDAVRISQERITLEPGVVHDTGEMVFTYERAR